MNWTPPQTAEFNQHYEDLFGNQPRALLQALSKALGRFPVASVLDALTGIAMRSERRQRPSIEAILDALSNAGQHVQKAGLCRYCDGVKIFPIQLWVMRPETATAMGLTPNDSRRICWRSSRTDIPEADRERVFVAIHKDLWGRWPKVSKPLTLNFHCRWCVPPGHDPAFTTSRMTNGNFSRLDPKFGHFAKDLERVLRGEMVRHGPEMDGKEIAQDENLWDELLDKAADENDMSRFERLKKARERLAKGGGIQSLLA